MGPKLSTRLVTGYRAAAGRLLTSLPILHPVISTSLDPLRSNWLARNWKQMPMWNKLLLDTNFFSAVMDALAKQCAKCLDVNGDYMEVWCVPRATHAPRIHQNQNKVLGITVMSPWLLNLLQKYSVFVNTDSSFCNLICLLQSLESTGTVKMISFFS